MTETTTEDAGHRIEGKHDCFLMNCRSLGREVESLRRLALRVERQARNAYRAELREGVMRCVVAGYLPRPRRGDHDYGSNVPDELVLRAAVLDLIGEDES